MEIIQDFPRVLFSQILRREEPRLIGSPDATIVKSILSRGNRDQAISLDTCAQHVKKISLLRSSGRRFIGMVELAKSCSLGHMIVVPLDLCTNQMAFSYGNGGWHYWSQMIPDYIEQGSNKIDSHLWYKFIYDVNCPTFTDMMCLHDNTLKKELPNIPWISYPWGGFHRNFTKSIESSECPNFVETNHDRKKQQFVWTESSNDVKYVCVREFAHTIKFALSIARVGYQIRHSWMVPIVTPLLRDNGEVRFVQHDGAHRLACLSALGYKYAIVRLDPFRHPPIRESNVHDWTYVRSGLISHSEALRFFNLYFELTGVERLTAVFNTNIDDRSP